ncbi:MAG: hypothetical protein HQK77_19220 [Desulfobacterales bacterium]|nr:hypothetical protein [Desulfobacterales bacterium]
MRKFIFICILSIVVVNESVWADSLSGLLQLSHELHEQKDYINAALGYRQIALSVENEQDRSAYRFAAAYEYVCAQHYHLAQLMVDQFFETNVEFSEYAHFLNGEAALGLKSYSEADIDFQHVLENTSADETLRLMASARLCRVRMLTRQMDEALDALYQSPADMSPAIEMYATYQKEKDKSPVLGGVLGIIPGLGYAYSGEYGSAIRSFIINALFIYGMIDTAQHQQWGFFGVIGFFEMTWYSGSIYGGIDAAYRYNENRLNQCIDAIDPYQFQLDIQALPQIRFTFSF